MRENRQVSHTALMTWDAPATVEGFVRSPANHTLLEYVDGFRDGQRPLRVLDVGCGAGRNAVPLARAGCLLTGTDLSWPMIQAAAAREPRERLQLAMAPMDVLPVVDRSVDLIIAHGIWNLARSDGEFRRAVREAARVAAPNARLFVFTFARHTLSPHAQPLNGERYVFTQFSGQPQVFLTGDQLADELAAVGFIADTALPMRELNLPPLGQKRIGGPPVILECGFQFAGA